MAWMVKGKNPSEKEKHPDKKQQHKQKRKTTCKNLLLQWLNFKFVLAGVPTKNDENQKV